MYFVTGNRIFEKDRVAAFVSFMAGLVFFIGLIVHLINYLDFSIFIEQFTKITCQSNLIAFIVAGFYFCKPDHQIFKTNFWPLFSVSLLWFAGLGFWCILFPIYYIDLGSFLISTRDAQQSFSTFYAIWNHTVTQFAALFFFYQLNKKHNFWHLKPISVNSFFFVVYGYLCCWVIWNVFISIFADIFPTYGILTNFNPYTEFKVSDETTNLFSLRSLIASHLACLVLILVVSVVFSGLSIKFRATSFYDITGEIPKKSSVPFVWF